MSENILNTIITVTIPSLIIVIGWIVNSYFEKKHNIFKTRFDIRMDMFRSCALFFKDFSSARVNDETKKNIEEINLKIQLYGMKQEIESWQNLVEVLKKEGPPENKRKKYEEFSSLIIDNLRKELGL